MHTCDLCGRDTHSPENLVRVISKDGSGDGFYDSDEELPPCDFLYCNQCAEKSARVMLVVEETGVLEAYIADLETSYKHMQEASKFAITRQGEALFRRYLRDLDRQIKGLKSHLRS